MIKVVPETDPENPSPETDTSDFENEIPSPETLHGLPDLTDLIGLLGAGGVGAIGQLAELAQGYPVLESANLNFSLNGGQNDEGEPRPKIIKLSFDVAFSESVR